MQHKDEPHLPHSPIPSPHSPIPNPQSPPPAKGPAQSLSWKDLSEGSIIVSRKKLRIDPSPASPTGRHRLPTACPGRTGDMKAQACRFARSGIQYAPQMPGAVGTPRASGRPERSDPKLAEDVNHPRQFAQAAGRVVSDGCLKVESMGESLK